MASFSTGEDLNAFVFDFGCSSLKAGFAGDGVPRCNLSTFVGLESNSSSVPAASAKRTTRGKDLYVADATSSPSPTMEFVPVMSPTEGLISNWDAALSLFDYALEHRLGISRKPTARAANPDVAKADQTEQSVDNAESTQDLSLANHPVLMCESVYTSRADREKWTEILFENYDCPGVFMSRSAVLALYANARTSGVSVDVGAGGAAVVPVVDGFPLMGGARRTTLGGFAMDKMILDCATYQGLNNVVKYPDSFLTALKHAKKGVGDIHSSIATFYSLQLCRDIRETQCRVHDNPLQQEDLLHAPSSIYELPDGSSFSLSAERIAIPELMFEPDALSLLKTHCSTPLPGKPASTTPVDEMFSFLNSSDYQPMLGLSDVVMSSMTAADTDLRRDLLANVVVTGGVSATSRFVERFSRDLIRNSLPGTRPRAVAANPGDRVFGAWIGGSILGSLGTFPDLWFSKEEYREEGKGRVHKKII